MLPSILLVKLSITYPQLNRPLDDFALLNTSQESLRPSATEPPRSEAPELCSTSERTTCVRHLHLTSVMNREARLLNASEESEFVQDP